MINLTNVKPLVLQEIFLPLSGFKGADILSEKYQVSNYGKIYNILDCCFCKLSLCGEPKYHYVTLTHKDVRKTLRVHRIEAMSFIENPDNLPIVDHIDRDRLNNFVGNLRWVTKSKNIINSDWYDNKGNNSTRIQDRVNYKGVNSETFSVYCKGKYYGRCETEEIAAKIYDVIARHEFTDPVLNFPDENICEYKDIYKYLNKRKPQRIYCDGFIKNIQYKWKYEYVTQAQLREKYNIPVHKLLEILKDIPKKERKHKTFSDKKWVERYYKRNLVREKYLGGEHSRRKLAKEVGVGISAVDNWLLDLPNLGKRDSLPEELQKDIYNIYTSGIRQCDVLRMYENINLTRSMMRNIRKKYEGK